ncbi:MAG TPA: DEAD/DEAH box helicase [bacterium]|nr:DEAD/DEAH box helicase [bacterium]
MAGQARGVGFDGLVDARLQKAIRELGWSSPTPIQAQVIPALKTGRDLVARAEAGSARTAAFGIPMLQRLDPRSKAVQGLVLVPNRDLAREVAAALGALGAHTRLRIVAISEGEPSARQVTHLRDKPHIVVGTPGRVLDHLGRGTLTLRSVTLLVLDAADRMLEMGFRSDVEQILVRTPSTRQTALFASTVPDPVRTMVGRYLRNPIYVAIASRESKAVATGE